MDAGLTQQQLIGMLASPPIELRDTNQDMTIIFELCFVVDCAISKDGTHDQDKWIQIIKTTLSEIVDTAKKESKKHTDIKVRVSFVGYRDVQDEVRRFEVMPFNENIDEVIQFVGNVKALDCGDERVPGMQAGFKIATLQDWTENAYSVKRIVSIQNSICLSPEGLHTKNEMPDFAKKEIDFTYIVQIPKETHGGKLANHMKEYNLGVDVVYTHEVKEEIRQQRIASVDQLGGVGDAEQLEMAKQFAAMDPSDQDVFGELQKLFVSRVLNDIPNRVCQKIS